MTRVVAVPRPLDRTPEPALHAAFPASGRAGSALAAMSPRRTCDSGGGRCTCSAAARSLADGRSTPGRRRRSRSWRLGPSYLLGGCVAATAAVAANDGICVDDEMCERRAPAAPPETGLCPPPPSPQQDSPPPARHAGGRLRAVPAAWLGQPVGVALPSGARAALQAGRTAGTAARLASTFSKPGSTGARAADGPAVSASARWGASPRRAQRRTRASRDLRDSPPFPCSETRPRSWTRAPPEAAAPSTQGQHCVGRAP